MAGAAPGAIMDEDYFGNAAEWGDEAEGGQVRGGTGHPRRGMLVPDAGWPPLPPPRDPSTARPAPSPRVETKESPRAETSRGGEGRSVWRSRTLGSLGSFLGGVGVGRWAIESRE